MRFENCRDATANGNGDWADVSVERHNLFLPSTNIGTKRLNCHVAATQNWGDVQAADYNFQLEKFGPNVCPAAGCNNPFRFSANPVKVRY